MEWKEFYKEALQAEEEEFSSNAPAKETDEGSITPKYFATFFLLGWSLMTILSFFIGFLICSKFLHLSSPW